MRILLSLVLSLLLTTPAQARQLRVMQPSRSRSVVSVNGVCTGFVAGHNKVVTAAHCLSPSDTTARVDFEGGYWRTFKVTKRGAPDSSTDAALLEGPTGNVPPLTLTEKVPTMCYFVGLGGRLGKNQMPCGVLGAVKEEGEAGNFLVIRGYVIPGDSGGPAFGFDGEVIGLVFAYATDHEGIGFLIPTATIKSVLGL